MVDSKGQSCESGVMKWASERAFESQALPACQAKGAAERALIERLYRLLPRPQLTSHHITHPHTRSTPCLAALKPQE